MSHLNKLEQDSIYVLRETKARFKNPCIAWAGGKDSTLVLYLAKKAFLGKISIPVLFVDTGLKFRETYNFIDRMVEAWELNLIVAQNREAIVEGVGPETCSKMVCCTRLKTDALIQTIKEQKFDAVVEAIRHDEHHVRDKEEAFSKRRNPPHMRVNVLLNWSEDDVWNYTKKENIPHNPLYDKVENADDGSELHFRSLGCYPCTKPVPVGAKERDGRAQSKEEIDTMWRLRQLGYF